MCFCCDCGKSYTINPKQKGYPEDARNQAIKMHFAGTSVRMIGSIMGFADKAHISLILMDAWDIWMLYFPVAINAIRTIKNQRYFVTPTQN